jgi:hypothetical protein
LPPDLTENDTIVLRCSGDTCFEIEGSIKKLQVELLTIQVKNPEHHHDPKTCPRKCTKKGQDHIRFVRNLVMTDGQLFDIRFKQTRVPVKMEKTALAIFEEQKLSKFMFPSVKSTVPSKIQRFAQNSVVKILII